MAAQVSIPARLAREARRRGLDLESLVLEAVAEKLSSDPSEELANRLSIAGHMLLRAREELEKGDAVQASEKIYKAVEEALKVLACIHSLEECERARREGGWWSRLLARAARRLSRILGAPWIAEAWAEAFDLHVHGFHEHVYSVDDVAPVLPLAERLVRLAGKKLRETPHQA